MKRDFIIKWFAERSILSKDEIEKDICINYFEKGLIDSFAFLELIAECEEKFNITFSDDDFANDTIFTINGLIEILEKAN